MPRLREVSRADADPSVLPLYDALFGADRDPVEHPGTATGTHCKALRAVGFSEEQIESIPGWGSSSCFDEIERAVLSYTDDLVLAGGRVPDSTFKVLKKHLSDEAILELTYTTCTYELHATMCRALRLEYDDVDERIKEVPTPEDEGRDIDFMGAVDQTDK